LATSAKSTRSVLVPAWPDGTAPLVRQARFALGCAKPATSVLREARIPRLRSAAEDHFVRKGRQKPRRVLPVRRKGEAVRIHTFRVQVALEPWPPSRVLPARARVRRVAGAFQARRTPCARARASRDGSAWPDQARPCVLVRRRQREGSWSNREFYRTVCCGLLVSSWINERHRVSVRHGQFLPTRVLCAHSVRCRHVWVVDDVAIGFLRRTLPSRYVECERFLGCLGYSRLLITSWQAALVWPARRAPTAPDPALAVCCCLPSACFADLTSDHHPSGFFGAASGAVAATCSGPCRAGFYCPPGSVSNNEKECGLGFYCPAQSAAPLPCPAGTC
jgi:hypothetical protein